MENYKRELIISLWSKRGAFWDAVRQLRETWHVVPEVAVEARRKERLPLLPPILCDMRIPATEQQKEDWSRTYAQWSESLLDLATEVVPAPLQGFKIHGHERPIEWEGFMSVCVRFDPPGDDLIGFAGWARFGHVSLYTKGLTYMKAPPIRRIPEPEAERQVLEAAWADTFDAVFELYLEPLGLSPEQVWKAIYEACPRVRKAGQDLAKLPRQDYIEVGPHTTKADVELAFSMIHEARKARPAASRPKRDRLICVEAAILRDQHEWPYENLAKRYGWQDQTLASKYIADGRQILQATS